jgi:leucyl aminopeptidase (aminopeptidase T)
MPPRKVAALFSSRGTPMPAAGSSHPPAHLVRMPPRAPLDFALMTPASRVVEELLVLVPNERIVIAHDTASVEIGVAFEHAAYERGAAPERIDMERLSERPWLSCPKRVLDAVADASATILVVRYEDGEFNVRQAFVHASMAARARHVHMIGVSRQAFTASMAAPVSRIFELVAALKSAMRPTSKLSVRSAAGTHLEIDMAAHLRWFANGNVVRAGQWINVPHGALVTSPGSVNGVYLADSSMGGPLGARTGSLANRPIRLTFENGRLKGVDCRDLTLKSHVERFMMEAQGHDRVGIVNLGANIGIVTPNGEIVHDENMPGIHLSLGDTFQTQTGATWTSHGQLGFACAECDVDLDGVPLIRRGRYVRFV